MSRRQQLMALLSVEIRESGDEIDRANLVYDVVKQRYEATKMKLADGGHADTDERNSLGEVVDQALDHQDAMFAAHIDERRAAEDPAVVAAAMAQLEADRADPAVAFQRLARQPRPWDGEAIGLTLSRAGKAAAVFAAAPASDSPFLQECCETAGRYLDTLAMHDLGLVAPTLAEMEAAFDAVPDPSPESAEGYVAGGGEVVPVTRGQATTIASLVRAYSAGNDLWAEAVTVAGEFLDRIVSGDAPGADAAWERLDELPWPPPRNLRSARPAR